MEPARDISKIEERLGAIEKELAEIGSCLKFHSIALNSLNNDRWALKEPLWVTVEERAKDDFVACLYEADVFGYGDSVPEALDELRLAIVNQFEALREAEREGPIANVLTRQLEFLRQALVESPER